MMERIKYAIDSGFTESWALRIGKLILNFASLEFESYRWLIQLSEQPGRITEFVQNGFRVRVDAVLKLVEERAFSDKWKRQAIEQWHLTREFAKLRNRIAHNPLIFGWSDDAEEGEPDSIGIADMQARKADGETDGPLMSRQSIEARINQISTLVQQLAALREEWCAIRDQGDDEHHR